MHFLPVPTDSRTRSSSGPFRFERDMFASVSELMPQHIADARDRVFQLREPTVGSVIPDLLFGEWGAGLRPLRRNFTFIEARIIALLDEHDELLEAEISQMLHLSDPAAARAFKGIERSGLIIRTRNGTISGPTPGCVISRRVTGRFSTSSFQRPRQFLDLRRQLVEYVEQVRASSARPPSQH